MLKNYCEPYASSFILIGNQLVWYEIREKFLAYLGSSCSIQEVTKLEMYYDTSYTCNVFYG